MAEEWDRFARRVLPVNCSHIQRTEMRRAFYGGAQAILFRVIATFAPEGEPTDADIQLMAGVDQELKDFAKDVLEGRA